MCLIEYRIGIARQQPFLLCLIIHAYAWNDNELFGFVAAETLLVDRRSRTT